MIYHVPSFSEILFIQAKFIREELSDCCFLFEFVSVRGKFDELTLKRFLQIMNFCWFFQMEFLGKFGKECFSFCRVSRHPFIVKFNKSLSTRDN